MPLPEHLADLIGQARRFMSKDGYFGPSTDQLLTGNVRASLQNAVAFVEPLPGLREAVAEAGRRAADVAQAHQHLPVDRVRLGEARAAAGAALDEVERLLSQAEPNAHARALGFA